MEKICIRAPIFCFALVTALAALMTGCGVDHLDVYWPSGETSPTTPVAPTSLSYRCATQVFLEATSNTDNTPTLNTTAATYSISPSLPAGLNLDPNTGIISGAPTVASAMTAYTVTATNQAGSTSAVVNIRTGNGWLVNDLAHDADNGGGAGSCTAVGLGTCTLRAAIDEINTGASARSIILLPGGTTGNALATSGLGQIMITQPMDIYGDCAQGSTVDGDGDSRVFHAQNSGNISFRYLTVQNGSLVNDNGAGILVQNTGVATFTAVLDHATIQNNKITGASGAVGAGIAVDGASLTEEVILNVNNSLFYQNQNLNTANGAGAAISFSIPGNNFTSGAVTTSSFISNSTGNPSDGGAVYQFGQPISISDSLFFNNTIGSGSGAALGMGIGTTITFTNDTFASNSVIDGGVSTGVVQSGGGATVNFVNCTFADNAGPVGISQNTDTTFANSLFIGNGSSNCFGGTLTSLGGNLTDSTAADCNLTQASDIVNTNAEVGSLQDNGGPTETIALDPTSPAFGAAVVANCPTTDQRGDLRHLPTSCDIGAYEHEP